MRGFRVIEKILHENSKFYGVKSFEVNHDSIFIKTFNKLNVNNEKWNGYEINVSIVLKEIRREERIFISDNGVIKQMVEDVNDSLHSQVLKQIEKELNFFITDNGERLLATKEGMSFFQEFVLIQAKIKTVSHILFPFEGIFPEKDKFQKLFKEVKEIKAGKRRK